MLQHSSLTADSARVARADLRLVNAEPPYTPRGCGGPLVDVQGTLKGYDQATNLVLHDCHERVYSLQASSEVTLAAHITLACAEEDWQASVLSRL